MPRHPLITLTTDFGLADGTVGAMVGVIKSICPAAEVVSLASDIPAHDIPRGAWALFQAAPFFPPETIHVVVVDPGVGSARRAVLAVTDHGSYLGPDNGVLAWALRGRHIQTLTTIANREYRIAPMGLTFDGRDLFAPAAAHLAAGTDPGAFGSAIGDIVPLAWPEPEVTEDTIKGEVLISDHFGNLITNIPMTILAQTYGDHPFRISVGRGDDDRGICGQAEFVRCYAEITGELGAVINGSGLMEIAGCKRSAARMTGLGAGAWVEVTEGVRS